MHTLNRGLIFGFILCLLLPAACAPVKKDTQAERSEKSPEIGAANCIAAQAVVTYFLSEGRTYLTEQQHRFCPDTRELQILTREPQGSFVWTWTGQQYSTNVSPGQKKDAYWDRPQILAVYGGFLYGGGFLSAGDLTDEPSVTLEGQRYIPMILSIPDKSIQIYLYQNQDTKKIDRILIQDKPRNRAWMAKCYNWSFYSPKQLLIPRKIDIFDISEGVASKKLILQVDYKQVL